MAAQVRAARKSVGRANVANVTEEQRKRARISAALTVVFIALFALAFVGIVLLLDSYASKSHVEDDISVGADVPTEPFHVLLIGSDSRKGTALYTGKAGEHAQLDQHSDIMTLMRIDPRNHLITFVTVPRDTVINGSQGKINDSLLDNDPEQVVKAVGDLTGTYADYYMMTTFISFENLINAIGGIDIAVPQTISVPDPSSGKKVTVKAGKNRHLNGAEALVLARARKEYGDYGEVYRQMNVRNIERTIIQKMLDQGDAFDVEHALSILEDDTKTNMNLSNMGLLLLDFVAHSYDVKFYECTGPYKGETVDGQWIVPENEQDWSLIMAAVNAGLDPSAVNLSDDPIGINKNISSEGDTQAQNADEQPPAADEQPPASDAQPAETTEASGA